MWILQVNVMTYPTDICDLFESVYNVDTCDSDTEDVSGPSDGFGFSGIRLRRSDLEAASSSHSLHIFNLTLSTGTFPSKWKDSFLIPIFKTGKRNDVGNYRGMAILSCFAKLFEVPVFDNIFFLVKSSIMSAQHGFFKGRSTVTNLTEFTSYVLNCMVNGVQVNAIYTDFFKAFEKVSHMLLLRKLAKLGFGGSFLAWIGSCLTGREQFVTASGS
jgi:hypothetical protein